MKIDKTASAASIAITGLSGRFPQSDSVDELWEHLLKGHILYQPDTFPYPKIFTKTPKSRGALKDPTLFDHEFFGYDHRSANALDPQLRILLEVVYEALWDAGVAPETWSGTRTGFYLGSSFEETGLTLRSLRQSFDQGQHFASRVSYHFNWRGPSMTVDTACASSLNALTEAYYGLLNGTCDQAVVAGICVHLKPNITVCFGELEMLSKSGKSHCLDSQADGYIRSEAVVAVVLQRDSKANRIYGKILGMATSSDGFTKEGITFPCRSVQVDTMKLALERSHIDPATVEYVEAHVTGTAIGDPIETAAIIQAYRGENVTKPLIIGCLKGNIGHAEASAGLSGLVKALKIFQHEMIPMNVGMVTPNPRIDSLREGKLISPRNNKPWKGELIGIDAFGFGGSNTHCLIAASDKRYPVRRERKFARRLVCVCNRSEKGLHQMVKAIEADRCSEELLTLLDTLAIGTTISSGMVWRGFGIVDYQVKAEMAVFATEPKLRKVNHRSPLVLMFDDCADLGTVKMNLVHSEDREVVNCLLDKTRKVIFEYCFSHGYQERQLESDPSVQTAVAQLSWADLLVHRFGLEPNLVISTSPSGSIAASYASRSTSWEQSLASLIAYIKVNHGMGNQLSSASLTAKVTSVLTATGGQGILDLCRNDPNFHLHLNNVDNPIGSSSKDYKLLIVSSGVESYSLTSKCESKGNQRTDLLTILGDLFLSGHNLDLRVMNEGSQCLPVSSSCPSLGHLIDWDHSSFDAIVYPDFFRDSFHSIHRVDLMDPVYSSLSGYSVEGLTLCPISCYIWIIWDHLVKLRCSDQRHRVHSFEIEALQVLQLIQLTEPVEFRVVSNPDNGEFAIKLAADYRPIVTGFAKIVPRKTFDYQPHLTQLTKPVNDSNLEEVTLSSEEFYFDLSLRGWKSGEGFKNVTTFNPNRSQCTVKFTNNNWITFFESILISPLLLNTYDHLMALPMKIDWFRCDPLTLNEGLKIQRKTASEGNLGFTVQLDEDSSTLITNGLICRFPEYHVVPYDLIPSDLHYRHQIFLPLSSQLQCSPETLKAHSASISTITKSLGLFASQTNSQVQQNSSSINQINTELSLSQIIASAPNSSTLRSNIDLLDTAFETEIIAPLCFDSLTVNLGLFEENCSSSGLLTIHQVGRAKGYSYDTNCDLTFRKIRNRYTFTLNSEANSISSADLVIYNHPSMGLTVDQTDYAQESVYQEQFKSLPGSSFLLILTREKVFPVEETISRFVDPEKRSERTALSLESIDSYSSLGFNIVSQYSVNVDEVTIRSILLRKVSGVNLSILPKVIHTNGRTFDWIDELKTATATPGQSSNSEDDDKIWLICNSCYRSGLIGLALALKEETFGSRIRAILAPGFDPVKDRAQFHKLRERDLLINVQINDCWGTFRHIVLNPLDEVTVQDESAFLAWTKSNLNGPRIEGNYNMDQASVNDLTWYRSPPKDETDPNLQVHYSTLNRLTLSACDKVSMDLVRPDEKVGWEFSGYNGKGERVTGLCHGNGTNPFLPRESIIVEVKVPNEMSLDSAATIPVPYSIAFYCLNILNSIRPGSKVFLSGSGNGIEVAMISLCLSADCRVYLSLDPSSGSPTKGYYLTLFPSLTDSSFISTTITSARHDQSDLERQIKKSTNHSGLDFAVNFGSSGDLQTLIRCLNFGGKIIHFETPWETTLKGPLNFNCLSDDQMMEKGITFQSFEPYSLLLRIAGQKQVREKLSKLLTDGLDNNQIKPIPSQTINRGQVQSWLAEKGSLMSNGWTTDGRKIVISLRDEVTSDPLAVKCIAKSHFDPNKCYLLIGGLGGIGLQLIRWMVYRGAKKVIITSRNGITSSYQRFIVNRLKGFRQSGDIDINIFNTPTSDYASCTKVIRDAIDSYGPIGGIFNLAGIMKSGLLESQTAGTFNEVCHSKIEISEHFDQLSRAHCPQLDYFVCFSSISALGILGEPNYGYANSYMERLCEDRRAAGLPGLAIQWGAIGDVGMAQHLTTSIAGSAFRRVLGVIHDLDKFLQLPYSVCYSVQHATKQEPLVSGKGNILSRIGHILGCQSLDKMDGKTTLGDLGLDSLQAIEVKNLIDTTCNISFSNVAILKLSIAQLETMASEALSGNNQVAGSTGAGPGAALAGLSSMEEPILINLTDKGTEPIFFFPPAFFDFLSMMPVAQALNRTVVGVQLTEKVRALNNFDSISRFYAETILEAYPNLNRYDFVGYSFGVTVSFELAKVLQEMIGKPKIDRIVFIDASPYGLKKLGQRTIKMVLAGLPGWQIFVSTMEFMGVKVDESTRRLLEESEDDEQMFKEVVTKVLVDVGMNGPTDSLVENAIGLIDRAYYLRTVSDMGCFDGDALFVQVINKAISQHGTISLVNEGLDKIIGGSLKTVMFNATHFDVLKVYAREVAAEIEKIMP